MPTKLLLVDGNNLVRRMAGVPAFQKMSYKGQPTGAIHASVTNLLDTIDKLRPDEVAIAFDGAGAKEKKQREIYSGYKAGRGGLPEGVATQLHATRDIFRAAGLAVFHQPLYDADDVIGSLSRMHIVLKQPPKLRRSVIVYSNDKDFFSLADDYTCIMRPQFDFWYQDRICERYGVQHPRYIADYLAIVGDGVDGIPGLPNIGPVTVKDWFKEYTGVHDLLDRYEGPKRAVLDDNADLLLKFLRLTKIDCSVFSPATLQQVIPKFTPGAKTDRLGPLLRQYGLTNLEMRLGMSSVVNGYKRGMFD